jgi:hypothetical protein
MLKNVVLQPMMIVSKYNVTNSALKSFDVC